MEKNKQGAGNGARQQPQATPVPPRAPFCHRARHVPSKYGAVLCLCWLIRRLSRLAVCIKLPVFLSPLQTPRHRTTSWRPRSESSMLTGAARSRRTSLDACVLCKFASVCALSHSLLALTHLCTRAHIRVCACACTHTRARAFLVVCLSRSLSLCVCVCLSVGGESHTVPRRTRVCVCTAISSASTVMPSPLPSPLCVRRRSATVPTSLPTLWTTQPPPPHTHR